MKKLAKSTKWLIGVLLALVMLLASFGIAGLVLGDDKGSGQDELTASGEAGWLACYVFINGNEIKNQPSILKADTDAQYATPGTSWIWREGTISTTYSGVAKDGDIHSFTSLGLTPTGSYAHQYANVPNRVTYTVTIGTSVYSRTYTRRQGYGEILNFTETDRIDPFYKPQPQVSTIPSSISDWFSSVTKQSTYTGYSLLPANIRNYVELSIIWNSSTSMNDVVLAGSYVIKATPKSGYKFSDGKESKTVVLTVNPYPVEVTPTKTKDSFVYNGKEQTGYAFSGKNAGSGNVLPGKGEALYKIAGNSYTNVGNYNTTLSLTDKLNLKWADGTTADKTYPWSITKAPQSFTFDKEKVELDETTTTVTIPLNKTSDVWNTQNALVTVVKQEVATAKLVTDGDNCSLQVTKGTQLGETEIKVKLVGNTNILDSEEMTLTVNNTVRDGFYISSQVDENGEPTKIYPTLEEALKAAGKGTKDSPVNITARGNVMVNAPVNAMLWDHLVLSGEEGSVVTATYTGTDANTAVFGVGMGKSLTLGAGLTIQAGGENPLSLAVVNNGGELTLSGDVGSDGETLSGVAIKNFTNSAVKVNGGNVTAENGASFVGNKGENGGAIYVAKDGTVTLGDVTFSDNSATKNGGAIYVANGATVTANAATHSEFKNNKAENGGAIYVEGGTVTVPEGSNVTMDGCSADGNGGNGGAIYVAGGTLDAQGGTLDIESGTASGKGGAVYVAQGADVTLGENTKVGNNVAQSGGNGVYIADGAKLNLSTNASGISDDLMLGHDSKKEGVNAQIELSGEAPTGRTIVVEFENPAEQLDTEAQKNTYITGTDENGEEFTSQALKGFMRVKNAGYTFDPAADDGSLGLMESGSRVAAIKNADGTYEYFTSVQTAIDAAAKNGEETEIFLATYTNSAKPEFNTTEVTINETLKIPEGANIKFSSATIEADDKGNVTCTVSEKPVVVKRDPSFTEEMVNVANGGKLTLGNITLDGGAEWEGGKISIKDKNGEAGSVESNNKGAQAHAPVIVNNGELTLGDGSTIQNNDNNWANPVRASAPKTTAAASATRARAC